MADWATFSGVVGIVLVLLLALARASSTVLDEVALSEPESTDSVDETTPPVDGADSEPASVAADETGFDTSDSEESVHIERESVDANEAPIRGPVESTRKPNAPPLSTPALLANVVLSQGLFGALLLVMAWYTGIPAWAFGLSASALTVETVGIGITIGVVLYGLNEAAAAVARWRGVSTPSTLREALAPETAAGWAILLVVVLPIIAGFEELLFRGALIGVVHAGFGVSPWLLAVGSSAAFALGHGAQGRLGIVVTGLLGVGLATAFVFTESLVVVIVAHYVVNAAEFVIHEAPG
jgi:membrane protease YdiL (CAAX protease family)